MEPTTNDNAATPKVCHLIVMRAISCAVRAPKHSVVDAVVIAAVHGKLLPNWQHCFLSMIFLFGSIEN